MSAALHFNDVPSAVAPVGRRVGDWYPTPAELVMAIAPHLPRFQVACDLGCGDGAILDALATVEGSRIHGRTLGVEIDQGLADRAASKLHEVWIADLLKDPLASIPRAEWRAGGASSVRAICREADLFCMNPPFEHAEHFVRVALEHRHPCATVAALLRISFGDSIERIQFHREYPEGDVYIVPNRIDFTRGALRTCNCCDGGGKQAKRNSKLKPTSKIDPYRCEKCAGKGYLKGGNDSAAVAWWVWGPGRAGRRFTLDPVVVRDIVSCPEMLVGGVGCTLEVSP